MSDSEREILDGLRALGAEEPRQAPQHVEAYLMSAFRRRAHRRRMAVWGRAVSAGVIAAGVAAAIWLAGPMLKRAPVSAQAISSMAPASDNAAEVRNAVVHADEVASSFYPLPEADALPPLEGAMVVRVRMPLASLQLMGFPVGEEAGADPVEADVLLGQDGLARGVRLIQ